MDRISPSDTLGILLVPLEKSTGKIEERKYVLRVGWYTRGMHKNGIDLISNPTIRRTILENKIKPGHLVGSTIVQINHYSNWMLAESHQPITDPRFKKMGVADHLDLLLERTLSKEFPTYHMRISNEASPTLRAQWEKRGRSVEELTPLPVAKEQTRRRVIQTAKKHRIIRRR